MEPIKIEPDLLGAHQGLAPAEAERILAQEGPNELPAAKPRSLARQAAGVCAEPMLLLLLVAGGVYLLLGDLQEALLLLGFVLLVLGLTLFQERRSEKALSALRQLASPRALVIRGGQALRIPGREVVRGDLIVLTEGDRAPADALVLSCRNLMLDESLLTGESEPVRKEACPDPSAAAAPPGGGQDRPEVFSGSLVVRGLGLARVTAVGAATQLGRVGAALGDLRPEPTPLQRQTGRLVGRLAAAGLGLSALVAVLYGLGRGDWLHALLAGLSLAMAMLPEEFPVVLAIFLALGARRIARRQVLTRRLPAVETLGAAQVLCVDKTGTLTQNRLAAAGLWRDGQAWDLAAAGRPLPEHFHRLLEYAVLASRRDPFDPLDRALREAGRAHLGEREHWHEDWELAREYPLTRELLALSHAWRGAGEPGHVVAAKGAPEAVADLCHLGPEAAARVEEATRAMGRRGYRAVGVAAARHAGPALPEGQHDFSFEFVGLVGLQDPLRAGASQAIAECRRAGIRVVMITGDHPATARAVADQAGLDHHGEVVTGAELAGMTEDRRVERLAKVNLFARTAPAQKLMIVQALQAQGLVVAMTGDGVNDAPALKAAHIGVAMGGRGTDVAREAADLVLLDDDFASIVAAVRLGRRIYANLKKAMAYILAVHVPIAGLSLAPLLFGWPLILLPVHIVFLEMIIDPACSVVFEAEPEEPGVMDRRPRDPAAPLFGAEALGLSLAQGGVVLAALLALFAIALKIGHGPDEARALAFTGLVFANLGLIMANRSWEATILASLRRPNPALWWVVAGAGGMLGLVLFLPGLRDLFHFYVLHLHDLLLCLGAALASIAWFEIYKLWRRKRRQGGGAAV
ncbi:MAG: cation-translocating P-type ATPase [Thermodesulfobacteriota bacterium]